jgi:hypothetical protein
VTAPNNTVDSTPSGGRAGAAAGQPC